MMTFRLQRMDWTSLLEKGLQRQSSLVEKLRVRPRDHVPNICALFKGTLALRGVYGLNG
jgi:hypothetical protein